MKLMSVVGARPQFIKLAPLVKVLRDQKMRHLLVHTGQHYDYQMSRRLFEDLGLPEPDYHLGVGSGSHGMQTGEMLKRVEEVIIREQPDWVLVYGDTNSTLAGGLAAAKLYVPVAHIEAGLRSYNRRMPEELNRVLTDHLATLLCCPTLVAVHNLAKEGFVGILNNGRLITPQLFEDIVSTVDDTIPAPWVVNTGDIMLDAYLQAQDIAARNCHIMEELGLETEGFYLATVHRAENTDNPQNMANIVQALLELSRQCPVIWSLHPRTYKSLKKYGLITKIDDKPGLRLLQPLGYFEMLTLEKHAAIILTDSGGVQKEAFFAGTPCITLREETEWVETLADGANILAGTDPETIILAILKAKRRLLTEDTFGNGQAAFRILECLTNLPLNSSQSKRIIK